MLIFPRFLILLALWLTIGGGCSAEQNPGKKHDPETKTSVSSQQIQRLNPQMLDDLIINRNGLVLLINVWATWCIPCREEFPDLVKLAEKYQGKGLDVIGISADYPDEITSKILPFIESEKVNFPIYVQNFDKQENFINYFNQDWSGALPATFIYDKSGAQQKFLLGKHSYQDFKRAVEELF